MIEALEGVTDEELFNAADEHEETAEVEVPKPEQTEQPHTEEPAVTDPPAPAPVDDTAAMVPSWRVREINEERRRVTEENERIKAELAEMRRAPQAPAPQPAQVEKAAKPDPLLDPEGYEAYLEQKFEEKQLSRDRESSLALAHKTYKTEFEEAYAAAQKQVDPVLKMKMQNSRDPGETLIEWHREQKTRAEVGTDPNAYFDKRFEAYLSDPANQAKVLERIRGGVQPQQPGAKQAAPVNLPPSLTRATNASPVTSADDDDVSNEGLWRHSNA